ncbi:MAG: hypothetical protein J6V33_00425 [Bacteroidales bacterium]|nr:hypothetical protein [Bacteroidales bacterium]
MVKRIMYLMVFFILYSCSGSVMKETEIVCMSENSYSSDYMQKTKNILEYGDTNSYWAIHTIHSDDCANDKLLPYALVMANKFNFTPAYYHVFEILVQLNCERTIDVLDSVTRYLAVSYFRKAIESGDKYASDCLLQEYCDTCTTPIKELYTDTVLMSKAFNNIEFCIR